MKKVFMLLLAAFMIVSLTACGTETASQEASCGHEGYEMLLEALDKKDYDAARKIINELESPKDSAPAELEISETKPTETESLAASVGNDVVVDMDLVTLDRHNLLDYFELREDYIFEDTVKCYQYFLLKEEYEKRLLDIADLTIEISGFDATAYGELDHGDQLFFPARYEMTTGELTYRNVHVTKNGEGHIALTEYDEKNRCFEEYLMDIAITEVTGKLVLEPK